MFGLGFEKVAVSAEWMTKRLKSGVAARSASMSVDARKAAARNVLEIQKLAPEMFATKSGRRKWFRMIAEQYPKAKKVVKNLPAAETKIQKAKRILKQYAPVAGASAATGAGIGYALGRRKKKEVQVPEEQIGHFAPLA